MPKSIYLDNNFLSIALLAATFSPPAVVYVALFTVSPTPSGGGTEVGGGGYGRQTVTFIAPVNGQTQNFADIFFPIATSPWGTIVAFGLFDASSGGNMLYFGALSTSRSIMTTDQLKFPAGQLIATES
jgi:hypothetical protein